MDTNEDLEGMREEGLKQQGQAEVEFWQGVRSQTHWQALEAKAQELISPEVEHEQKLEAMEEHLQDLVFDLVQTIESFKELGEDSQSNFMFRLDLARSALATARFEFCKDRN